jgi:hypothetical protein
VSFQLFLIHTQRSQLANNNNIAPCCYYFIRHDVIDNWGSDTSRLFVPEGGKVIAIVRRKREEE